MMAVLIAVLRGGALHIRKRTTDIVMETVITVLHTLAIAMVDGTTVMDTNGDVSVVAMEVHPVGRTEINVV